MPNKKSNTSQPIARIELKRDKNKEQSPISIYFITTKSKLLMDPVPKKMTTEFGVNTTKSQMQRFLTIKVFIQLTLQFKRCHDGAEWQVRHFMMCRMPQSFTQLADG